MIRQNLASNLDIATIGGRKTINRFARKAFVHPWSAVELVWFPTSFGPALPLGAWCMVIRPGFVNGVDPIMRGAAGYNKSALGGVAIASERAGLGGAASEVYTTGSDAVIYSPGQRSDTPLLDGPIMALNFRDSLDWPQGKWTPLRIQNYGVAPNAGDGLGVAVDLNTGGVQLTGAADKTYNRVAKSVDVVIGVARQGLHQSVSNVAPSLEALVSGDIPVASGRLITYSVNYDQSAVKRYGSRPFIYQVADYDAVAFADQKAKNPTFLDKLSGDYQIDDMIDKTHLMRVWAISPDLTQANYKGSPSVDESWTIEVEYKSFWNLCYQTRIPKIVDPPPPISFYSGLGLGIGDTIVNSYLALQDELTQRVFEAGVNYSPDGRFWSI